MSASSKKTTKYATRDLPHVATMPVTDDPSTISWDMIKAYQCDGNAAEAELGPMKYFSKVAVEVAKLFNDMIEDPAECVPETPGAELLCHLHKTLERHGANDVLSLVSMAFKQLEPCLPPGQNAVDLPACDFSTFQPFVYKDQQYVLSPSDQWHKVSGFVSLWSKLKLSFRVDCGFNKDQSGNCVQGLTYGFELSGTQRGTCHIYRPDHKAKDHVISISVGDYVNREFKVWNVIKAKSKEHFKILFDMKSWPMNEVEAAESEAEDTGEIEVVSAAEQFFNDDCRICLKTERKKETIGVVQANFMIVKVLKKYMYAFGGSPSFLVLARHRVPNSDPNGATFYLSHTNPDRFMTTDGYSYVEAEVLLEYTLLNSIATVRQAFGQACAIFVNERINHTDLLSIVNAVPQPASPSMLISHWGDQFHYSSEFKDYNVPFVLSNVAFKRGELLTLEETGFDYLPSTFMNNAVLKTDPMHFPKMAIIEQPWILYYVAKQGFSVHSRNIFANNLIPAWFVTWPLVALNLNAARVFNGQLGSACMPVVIAWSPGMNTGKSMALKTAYALSGRYNVPLFGGDITLPVVAEAASMYGGLVLGTDDVIFDSDPVKWSKIARMCYDRTERAVSSESGVDKQKTPRCGLLVSSNQSMCNMDRAKLDPAAVSKTVHVLFEPLNVDGIVEDPLYEAKFDANCKMLSAVMPVLQQLGMWHGAYDKQAYQDVCTYLSSCASVKRNRSVREWAKLLYLQLLLMKTFQESPTAMHAVLHFAVNEVTRVIEKVTTLGGEVDQFLVAVCDVIYARKPNPVSSKETHCIFWHNFRTTEKPVMQTTAQFYSFQLEMVVSVIKTLTGRTFNETSLRTAMKKDSSCALGHCNFYDAKCRAWPITADPTDPNCKTPIAEGDLPICAMLRQACVFVKKDRVAEIHHKLYAVQNDVNITGIVIKSAAPTADYNFYDAVVGGDWFGWRAIPTVFANYCGVIDMLYVGSDTDAARLHTGVDDVELSLELDPENLSNSVGYTYPPEKSLPAILCTNPWEMAVGSPPQSLAASQESVLSETTNLRTDRGQKRKRKIVIEDVLEVCNFVA